MSQEEEPEERKLSSSESGVQEAPMTDSRVHFSFHVTDLEDFLGCFIILNLILFIIPGIPAFFFF